VSPPTSIDPDAPVIAHHEIDIRAPIEIVWNLHSDVNEWTTWQGDITAAHIDEDFEPGASFAWTSFGFSVTSTIYEVADRSRVLWGGSAEGITGVHEWLFEETSDGVHVTTNESFAGVPVVADSTAMQSMLDASLTSWLEHLKVAAESRA
jgi:Polyketide cyclase / dehydrase and lipid transport